MKRRRDSQRQRLYGVNATDVVTMLEEFGVGCDAGPNGIVIRGTIGAGWPFHTEHARVERGSGIAGRGDAWSLVLRYPSSGHVKSSPYVTTRKALRKIIREWMAGPRPPTSSGATQYATRLHSTSGTHFVWSERRT